MSEHMWFIRLAAEPTPGSHQFVSFGTSVHSGPLTSGVSMWWEAHGASESAKDPGARTSYHPHIPAVKPLNLFEPWPDCL